jgi:RND superfamily putative drug exporter
VFTGFAFAGLLEIKQIGFGLAVGVLLDAFFVRILILPSLMALLGRANWWPSRAVHRAEMAAAASPAPVPTNQPLATRIG